MAYNLDDRFPRPPKNYRLLEPTAYQNKCDDVYKFKPNKAPFLSKTERNTLSGRRLWTDSMYHTGQKQKIPNCTSFMSKCPRFPYEALSKEDLEAILCRCGLQNVCECAEDEQEPDLNCHANIRRQLYVGHPPTQDISGGLAVPSRRDFGFQPMPDGTFRRIFIVEKEKKTPFYDANVIEASAFYRGCKWSHWRSTRTAKLQEVCPGPADYTIERQPSPDEICQEKVREQKRKHSKQLRFIEIIQQKDLLEQRPGPANYNPHHAKGASLEHFGPKAERFQSYTEQGPGPADYWLKRDFDPPHPPIFPCHAKLPEPSFFGVKAARFKPSKEEGPSPATFRPNYKMCQLKHCPAGAAFGSSAARFKDMLYEEDEYNEIETESDQDEEAPKRCYTPTWEFKSKTIRIKPLDKKPFEQSPADLAMSSMKVERHKHLQYVAPFYTSEGRFQPWYDWIPVFGRIDTPGPGYYNLEKTGCQPAVCHGPIYRAERFPPKRFQNPAPNEYKVGRGLETILATHNKILKSHIKNKHKFHWKPPLEPKQMSIEERESMLLQKSIALCNVQGETADSKPTGPDGVIKPKNRCKMLKSYLFRHTIEQTF